MPKIVFIEHDGTQHLVDAEVDKSVMQNALDNMIPGITGDCGGCAACGTCHCYVDEPWAGQVGGPSGDETLMLEGVLSARPSSRLSCQIRMTAELDGITLRLPEMQS